MKKIEIVNAVENMQRYIDRHIEEEITLYELAKCSGYSPWHSARIFKELVGQSPFEYIRMLRLSKAALDLRDFDHKIIDVALEFMFDSHEGFTRAFRKQFDLTPQKYKKEKSPLYLFQSSSVKDYYQIYENPDEFMKLDIDQEMKISVEVTTFPKRKMILKRADTAED